jgi:hypothetical protein
MKKLISLFGALFVGSVTFAQVSKTEGTTNTVTRKVLESDVKKLPADQSAAPKGEIHGTVTQKGREGKAAAKEDYHIKIGNIDKTVADPKATEKSPAKETEFLKISTEKK